jgi:protein-disulfide isomerase
MKHNLKKAKIGLGFVVLTLAVFTVFSGCLGASEDGNPPTDGAVRRADDPSATTPTSAGPTVDDDTLKGSEDAPVTIIEFSDYECPFCARFFDATLAQIDEVYIKTGKVKMVFRDFPLSFHKKAQKAAEAAECAGEQDKYWEMHDILFGTGELDVPSLKQHAATIGLDTETFNTCLASNAMAGEVNKDFKDGRAAGVRGTPAFYINGRELVGAQPFGAFKEIIEEELAK